MADEQKLELAQKREKHYEHVQQVNVALNSDYRLLEQRTRELLQYIEQREEEIARLQPTQADQDNESELSQDISDGGDEPSGEQKTSQAIQSQKTIAAILERTQTSKELQAVDTGDGDGAAERHYDIQRAESITLAQQLAGCEQDFNFIERQETIQSEFTRTYTIQDYYNYNKQEPLLGQEKK